MSLGFASSKVKRWYMIDRFRDTTGPGIGFRQGAEAVYYSWVHGYYRP